jgi:hypothetical protein
MTTGSTRVAARRAAASTGGTGVTTSPAARASGCPAATGSTGGAGRTSTTARAAATGSTGRSGCPGSRTTASGTRSGLAAGATASRRRSASPGCAPGARVSSGLDADVTQAGQAGVARPIWITALSHASLAGLVGGGILVGLAGASTAAEPEAERDRDHGKHS